MTTLTDFLLARIAEDEEAIRFSRDCAEPVPIAHEQMLAECEARRRIVGLSWHHLGEDDYGWGMEEAKRQILALLALPYADHADYDESWRP